MARTPNSVGFQPRTTPAERRADLDLRRLLGNLPSKVSIGSTAGTTSVAGVLVVNHDLGEIPEVVLVSTPTSTIWHLAPHTYTATGFTVTVRSLTAAGATVNSTGITVNWMAAA